jgi:hypothetical protein
MRPLEREDIADFVEAYVAEYQHAEVASRIAPLIDKPPMPNPLFLRFAIEQALRNPLGSTKKLDLVMQYIEGLRSDELRLKIDLRDEDMVRAASAAAIEAVRDSLVPREIERLHLRAILMKEADEIAFLSAQKTEVVEPATVIDMLVASGLLTKNRANRRLQFTYDPVAEFLAAWRLFMKGEGSLTDLRERVLAAPKSAIGRALAEITDVGV